MNQNGCFGSRPREEGALHSRGPLANRIALVGIISDHGSGAVLDQYTATAGHSVPKVRTGPRATSLEKSGDPQGA